MKKIPLFLFWALSLDVMGQSYFSWPWPGLSDLYKINTDCSCSDCCEVEFIGPTNNAFVYQISMSSDGNLYGKAETEDIYKIDTLTGLSELYFDIPDNSLLWGSDGLLAMTPTLFYTITYDNGELYEINTATGVITNLGTLPYVLAGDITLFDGEIYYHAITGVVPVTNAILRVNLGDPSSSEIVFNYPGNYIFFGITASAFCNTLVGVDYNSHQFCYLNLLDGTITPVCQLDNSFH